jgi:hypothetical protein
LVNPRTATIAVASFSGTELPRARFEVSGASIISMSSARFPTFNASPF